MRQVLDDVLISINPATGEELGRVQATPTATVTEFVVRAKEAQSRWAETTWRERKAVLTRWWRILSRDVDLWSDLIRDEIGKPRNEALAGDVISTLDAMRWTVKNAGRALKPERVGPAWQRWLLMPRGKMHWSPLGVVGMLGTWNYPLFLNAPPIAQALAAGNGVVWKPSELALLTGKKLQESLDEAGIPRGLVATVFGGPEVGQALVDSEIDKGMFTGGIDNGRRVMGALASRGIPAVAELSGFDPAIILPDAPLESTVRALTWAAFVGCGQTCVATKRVYVVGDPTPWADAFAAQAKELQVGDPARLGVDIGPMISESARGRFAAMIQAATQAGAKILAGGRALSGPGWYYEPTVLLAESDEPESALAGSFGPVVVVRGVVDSRQAVADANASRFALGASVWGRDREAAGDLARQIQAGTVSINEAVTPTAHAAAPFGGMKASGYGRTHGILGLREFTQPKVVFNRRAGGFRPQLFPYAKARLVERFMAIYQRIFHPRA